VTLPQWRARARSAVTRPLRALDHAVGRLRGPARVLIDVRTPMNLAVLQPIWRSLLDDSRVRLSFATEDGTEAADAVAAWGIQRLAIARRDAAWTRVDLALTADLWNHTPLRRCRRRMTFFHGVAGKYDLDDPARLDGDALRQLDRIGFINEDRLRRYVESGRIRRDQAVLIGFPKLDDLVNGRWQRDTVLRSLGLSAETDTVLYAPTFSTANSLHDAGEAIVDTLLGTGRNVIVKLHDRSMVPHRTYTAGVDWPERLARFEAHPRFALARMADAGPLLAAADLMVTDHSTVGFEFAALDRPIVVFDAPRLLAAARIDPGKWALLRSMADVVTSAEQLVSAVDRALRTPARLAPARRQARALFANAGSATERALAEVYGLLNLTPFRPTAAAVPSLRGGAQGEIAPLNPI
jgi:hypothetical protein